MNRLRQPGDSDYDVLGLSPGATDDEINRAFRELIDGGGYKVGVPLNRQWLRAHQIKAAYAALSDLAKRRTHEESLSVAPEPAPWAMAANDPATDELILREIALDAPEPIEHSSAQDAVVPIDQEESSLAGSEPERTPAPDSEAVVGIAPAPDDYEPAPAPAPNDNEHALRRRWGVAAVAASGLGLVLASSLMWKGPPSTSGSPPRLTANAGQASDGGRNQSIGNLNGAAATSASQEMSAPAANSPAEPAASGSSNAGPTENSDEIVASGAAQAANVAPAGTTPAAAAPSVPRDGAETEAPMPAPPAADAQAIATAPVVTESSGDVVRSPPQWVGGGPTDADNRRGRFQGEVTVQVAVEPSGRVSSCAAVQGSGNAGLDAMTCRLIRERAQFTPALDRQGRPVASQAYTTIVWGRRRRR